MEIVLFGMYLFILIGALRVSKKNRALREQLKGWDTAVKIAEAAASMSNKTGQSFDDCMNQIQKARNFSR